MEPLEVFMEYYNKLVPHIYIPEPAVMEVCSDFVLIHVEGQPSLLLFGWAVGVYVLFPWSTCLDRSPHPQSHADIRLHGALPPFPHIPSWYNLWTLLLNRN